MVSYNHLYSFFLGLCRLDSTIELNPNIKQMGYQFLFDRTGKCLLGTRSNMQSKSNFS